MLIVTVSGKVKPEFRQNFLDHMAEMAVIVRQKPGCLHYQQNISADDDNSLFLYEEWQSEELWLQHFNSQQMAEHLEEARPWFDSVELTTLQANEVKILEG